jgi:hypothetical protein
LPAGAEAFRRDLPTARLQFLDTGHFALETHLEEISEAMRNFSEDMGRDVTMRAARAFQIIYPGQTVQHRQPYDKIKWVACG